MNAVPWFRPVFFLLLSLISTPAFCAKQFSCNVQKPPTDLAFQAFTRQDYSKALELYTAAANSNPADMDAIAGQVRSLLEDQQVDSAAKLAENSFAAHPTSAVLETVLGEVRFRQGRLADTFNAFQASERLDPCLARTRYKMYRMMRVESMYNSAHLELQTAHQLEPDDPDIHLAWIENLPLAERKKEIDAYLSTSTDTPMDEQQNLKEYADRLRAILAAKNSGCHLTSSSAITTTLPFAYIMKDPSHFDGMGFDVTVNNKARARLELDTGASGILIDRGTARKAGLIPITVDNIAGIGDEKKMTGYWAYADDFRVGSLEFKDCMVEVSDRRSINGIDGLIGADVFENYHVQLDFPVRKMTLSQLPSRPGEVIVDKASLNASGVGTATASTRQPANIEESAPTPPKIHDPDLHYPSVHYVDRYISPEMQTWSPFARIGHQILINAQLKDRAPRLFLLDSGANSSLLSIPAAKSVGKIHFDSDHWVEGLNGRVKKIYTADHVDVVFAGLRDPLTDVLVMDTAALSKSDGTEVSGLIGLDTLLMLTVDIDYRDGLIHLTFDPKHGRNIYTH